MFKILRPKVGKGPHEEVKTWPRQSEDTVRIGLWLAEETVLDERTQLW